MQGFYYVTKKKVRQSLFIDFIHFAFSLFLFLRKNYPLYLSKKDCTNSIDLFFLGKINYLESRKCLHVRIVIVLIIDTLFYFKWVLWQKIYYSRFKIFIFYNNLKRGSLVLLFRLWYYSPTIMQSQLTIWTNSVI